VEKLPFDFFNDQVIPGKILSQKREYTADDNQMRGSTT
jgi:hypothetical protein